MPRLPPRWADLDAPAEVLAFARERRAVADRAEADLLQAAVVWADQHPAESLEAAEVFRSSGYAGGFGDTAVPLAGPGAPLVAEFSVAEFAAAVGLSTEAGKRYVGHAVELRYRLTKLWKRVVNGDLPAWKARRAAEQTISHALTSEAAAFVDAHVAPVAHKIRTAALDRLVEEAIARFMPETAEEIRHRAADGRHFTIDHDQVSFAGTSLIHGELDLADALDLDQAVGRPRRRSSETWAAPNRLTCGGRWPSGSWPAASSPSTSPPTTPIPPTLRWLRKAPWRLSRNPGTSPGARSPSTSTCTSPRSKAPAGSAGWRTPAASSPPTRSAPGAATPTRRVTVKPVIDLADHVHVDAYEVPDRIAEPVALRDVTCVFPWCSRPARRLRPDQHGCDCDHVVPHTKGGATCTCQLAPLCRRHHRLKTHGGWTYTILEPGSYLWSSPHGYQFLRDHTGTLDVSRDRRSPAPRPDE